MAKEGEKRLTTRRRRESKGSAATSDGAATRMRADFVSAGSLPFEGRLGVAVLRSVGVEDETSPHLEVELARLAADEDVSGVVSLLMAREVDSHGYSVREPAEAAERLGLSLDGFALRPDSVPEKESTELYLGFVTHLVERLKGGENVMLYSGVDATRCGMVVGSVLVASGLDPATAIGVVDQLPGELLAHEPQRTFITSFARSLGIVGDGLTPIVEACLRARGWKFEHSQEGDVTTFDLMVSTAAATYPMRLTVRERMRAVTCMFRLPMKVPADRRHAVAALACHLNYCRWLGAFEMDLRDGDLIFRADLQIVDGTLGPESVQETLWAGFATCDAAVPKVCRVAFAGEAPEAVLERGAE